MRTVLIVDDEPNVRISLADTFRIEGYEAQLAEHGEAALDVLERGGIDLALLDVEMPRLDGIETLRRIRERGWTLPVIFLTAHATIERAVEAVRLGAFDFIEKPPHVEKILLVARNALRQADLEQENRELSASRFDMIGTAPAMKTLYEQIRRTAPTQARVLILGENGTGKELVARALHRHSPRAAAPFVRVNCAAVPRDLFESEVFGHERGAFTGATARRKGKFLRAHGGTLFLDEVAEIPTELQAKLLRALESGEIEPVGADREIRVDVRVLSATNRDLERAVAEGAFRRDLFYRLQVVSLTVPPLRERRGDVPALVGQFLRLACDEHGSPKTFTDDALERLASHDFPGNVRELKNLVERLVILTVGETIDVVDVAGALPASRGPLSAGDAPVLRGTLRETLAGLERRLIVDTLDRLRWRMTAAADLLGLERSHLYKKMKALGIERPD